MKKRRLSNGPSFAFLTLLFLFFFVVPVLLVGPFLKSLYLEESSVDQSTVDNAFLSPVNISGRGAFLKVQSAEKLSPLRDKDFLAIAWFNMQDLPEAGQRMFMLSRYDITVGNKSGYAVAISRTMDALRPEVYWRDHRGNGGWYTFSDIKFLPSHWFMIGLTYYDDSKLGLFIGVQGVDGKVKLQKAGGYDLGRSIIPSGSFPLKVGSVKTGLFTGNIGPVGIFLKKGISGDLKSILSSFLKDPVTVPEYFNDEDILFWSIDAKTDLSPYNHELKFIDPTKGKVDQLDDL